MGERSCKGTATSAWKTQSFQNRDISFLPGMTLTPSRPLRTSRPYSMFHCFEKQLLWRTGESSTHQRELANLPSWPGRLHSLQSRLQFCLPGRREGRKAEET